MSDGVVRGPAEMAALGRRFEAAAHGGVRKAMDERLRFAMDRLRPIVVRSAGAKLPKTGGLAAIVAHSDYVVTSVGDGVQLTATGRVDLSAINAGRLSHPVFGNKPNVTQDVPPGFFDDPARESEPEFRAALGEALEVVKRGIEGHTI